PMRRATTPTLFPYTTLFRSVLEAEHRQLRERRVVDLERDGGLLEVRERCVRALLLRIVQDEVALAERAALRVLAGHTHGDALREDRKSTRLNSSHVKISYAV